MHRIGYLLVAMLVAAFAVPAGADDVTVTDDPRFPTDWHLMAEGDAGTFGQGNAALAELGHQLGADLLEGRIRMPDAETVEFQLQLTNLPATGGIPEIVRYTWDLFVDTGNGQKQAQIDGKFTNYSRGVCDPTAGCHPTEGDPPQDPGLRPFVWRGDLEVLETPAISFNAMRNYATIEAEFDVEAATITVSVPTETISLLEGVEWGDCSRLIPGAGLRGGVVETSFAVWITSAAFPHDAMLDVWPGDPVFTAPPALDATEDCFGNPL